MRAGMLVLGLGLGILWVAGLSGSASAWLVWLDFVGVLVAVTAGLMPEEGLTAVKASPFAVGGGLLVLWIIGLAAHATTWMVWWTFAFGIAFLVLGAAMVRGVSDFHRPSHA